MDHCLFHGLAVNTKGIPKKNSSLLEVTYVRYDREPLRALKTSSANEIGFCTYLNQTVTLADARFSIARRCRIDQELYTYIGMLNTYPER